MKQKQKTTSFDKTVSFPTDFALNSIQADLFNKIESTHNNYFIQGQAGTGKSTFIRFLLSQSQKRILIACPTALAALQIGGVTLHSLFRLPLKDFFILSELELKRKTATVLKKTDMLIIDEASMIRPDVLDSIDLLCKQARLCNLPFGGIQIILVGDLCQLPPVIKSSTYTVFKAFYGFKEPYFFDAPAFKQGAFQTVIFSTVYRQEDSALLSHLIDLRHDQKIQNVLHFFNGAKFENDKEKKTAVTITPYKTRAEEINQTRLSALSGEEHIYEASVSGSFEKSTETPAPRHLVLKEGALVIFNKNNPPQWINGSTGIVMRAEENLIWVKLLHDKKLVLVKPETWESYVYDYNAQTDEVIESVSGTFTQFPLQLGYALTIHKAQGKTLDKVIIDMHRGAFASGQLYVALSRTRKLKDMHLTQTIYADDVIVDKRVLSFLKSQTNP